MATLMKESLIKEKETTNNFALISSGLVVTLHRIDFRERDEITMFVNGASGKKGQLNHLPIETSLFAWETATRRQKGGKLVCVFDLW